MPRCNAMNVRGERCGGPARVGRSYCNTHDAEVQVERQAARSRGGQTAKSRRQLGAQVRVLKPEELPRLPTTLAELGDFQRWLLEKGATGLIDARTLKELGTVARHLGETMRDQATFERIRALTDEIERLKSQAPGRPPVEVMR